jgi:inosose dehydratase
MENNNLLNRRDFVRLAGIAGAAALIVPNFAFEEAKKRKFKIGSTFILWGYGPDNLEPALKDISALGYHSFETFGNVIDEWETKRGGFGQVVQKYGVPIISAFCATDVLIGKTGSLVKITQSQWRESDRVLCGWQTGQRF